MYLVANSYLVTGGFGFLGGRMAQLLHKEGHRVVLGSRTRRAIPAWMPGAEVRETLWNDEGSLAGACRGIDVVIHAAGMDAPDCAADPAGAFAMNQIGTSKIVQAACLNGVRRFVFLSTAHVYSAQLEGVITEDSPPTNHHPYAASNLAGENEVVRATENQKTLGIVIRMSNGFGVPASPDTKCGGLVINDLCQQAATTRRMVLKTTGMKRRDFISMSDAVEAIYRLAEGPEPGSSGSIFNLGGGWAPTIWGAALLIQERCHRILGFSPEIERVSPGLEKEGPALDFRSEALRKIGILVPGRQTEEIDRLLKYHQMIVSSNA